MKLIIFIVDNTMVYYSKLISEWFAMNENFQFID